MPASVFTFSVRSFHTPETPFTCAWPPSLPSVPTSRATRVTSSANDESWSTIVLTVFLSSSTSPLTSTVTFFERSPFATAVVTSAMFRTWPVRLEAIWLTESVRSFQVPETPFTRAWPPSLPSVPTSRATRVTSSAKVESWSTIAVHGRADAAELAAHRLAVDLELDPLRQVAVGDRVDHARDLDRRPREVVDQLVDRADLLRPRARRPRGVGALVDAAFATDDLADPRELLRHPLIALDERVERRRHLGQRALGAQPHGEVAVSRGLERRDELVELSVGQLRRSVPGTRARGGLPRGLGALARRSALGAQGAPLSQRGSARSYRSLLGGFYAHSRAMFNGLPR